MSLYIISNICYKIILYTTVQKTWHFVIFVHSFFFRFHTIAYNVVFNLWDFVRGGCERIFPSVVSELVGFFVPIFVHRR